MIARALVVACLALPAAASMAEQALVAGKAVAIMPMPADARAQLYPAVAYDGKGTYLVVWQQGRFYHQSQSADILATRVDSQGRVLDRQPIVVCNVGASQEQPQVTYAEGRFLVVWHDLRNGRDWDVYAARVNPDGRVLEPNGFLVAGGAQNQASPVVAPADGGYLVVWQHYSRYYQLQASRIPAAGVAAPGYPLKFRGEALWGGGLALTRVGNGWVLSWNDEKAWSLSSRGITRHFARLADRKGNAAVLEVQRSPTVHVGQSGGRFASDDASSALYAGWGVAGRGHRIASAALFDAARALPLKSPNSEQFRHWPGWNPERMVMLYDNLPMDGPVATAYSHGVYLTAAREAYSGKPSDRNRLLGSRLTTTGVRIDKAAAWPVLHDSQYRIANPALAGGARQFLLAFEQDDTDGRRQIWAKILKTE